MKKLTFEQLIFLCQLNAEKKHVEVCLHVLKNEDCIFESGIVMSQNIIADLYKSRFEIGKEASEKRDDYFKDFEKCVQQLNKSKSELLGLTLISSEHNSFIIFYEPESKVILGVLKACNSIGIVGIEECHIDNVNKGFTSDAEKYSKGIFIRNWK